MAKLFHYSNSANLETLDPQQFGQNKSISPEYRQGTSHMVPRSYLYTQDKPEGVVANGRHRYEIDLPEDFKHYDLRQDPEGIIPATHKRTGLVGAGLSDEIEHEINRRGYHGYQPTDDVMISFRPIPVKKPNLFGKQEVSMSKNLKDKAIEVIKKAAAYLSANPDALAKAEEAVPGVVTPKTEAQEFPEHAAGEKNEKAVSVEQKEMKKDEKAPISKPKMEAALNAPPSKAAPGPKVNIPPKGSQIALKGKIKPESINKLKAAGYHPFFKDEMKECVEKAKMDEGKTDREKSDARFDRNQPLKMGSLKMRVQSGIHKPLIGDKSGTSEMGGHAKDAPGRLHNAKRVLSEIKAQPKPNLPKAEMEKASDPAVSKKISHLVHEGKPQKQAVAEALNMKREGHLTANGGYKKDELEKDNAPHAPGSPDDSAHDVMEEQSSLKEELAHLSPEGQAEMLRHLQTLSKPGSLRSLINRKIGKDNK